MMSEEWRDIKGYEGLYQVSNLGRIKSLKFGHTSQEGVLKLGKNISCGYLQIGLSKDGKKKRCYIHRLVAEAFLPNPDNLPQVNHKDEDKENNFAGNLEWCDAAYNTNYGTRNEKVSEKMTNGKKSKPVLQFSKIGEVVREWASTMECGRNGFSQSAVSRCCRGEQKQYRGFLWKYK